MEEVSTPDPMDILRNNGRGTLSRNLLTIAAAYDTARIHTVLPFHQIKTVDRDMKRRKTVRITNNPG